METKTDEFDYSKRTSKTQKFDPRLVTHIVQLAENGIPRKDLSNTYGVTCGTLGVWIANIVLCYPNAGFIRSLRRDLSFVL